jgi:hypothetical protein
MTLDPPQQPRGIAVHAVGGPTAVLEIGGVRLLTDPTFDPPGEYEVAPGRVLAKLREPALRPERIGPVDAVLLSHDQHADNLDTAGRACLARVPLVLTTASAAGRLGGACRAVEPWEHVDLPRPSGGALRVTRVPALHGPEGTEHLVGEVAGFVLSGDGVPTVYVSGDNASLDVVRAVAGRFPRIDTTRAGGTSPRAAPSWPRRSPRRASPTGSPSSPPATAASSAPRPADRRTGSTVSGRASARLRRRRWAGRRGLRAGAPPGDRPGRTEGPRREGRPSLGRRRRPGRR